MRYGRVMTSDEAVWTIAGNKIHEIHPSVKRLGFFVPDDKYIKVREGEVPTMEEADRQRNETEFFSYFDRNKLEKKIFDDYKRMLDVKEDPKHIVKTINDKLGYEMLYEKNGKVEQFFDYEKEEKKDEMKKREENGGDVKKLPWSFQLTYLEFGERYRFDPKLKLWNRYKRLMDVKCRLFISYPGSDVFYLRLLLKHRVGITSVEEMYSGPDGKRYETFKHTCLAWKYINNSDEYFTAIHEANMFGWFGTRLLKLFGSIIAEGDATNIREIWDGVDPNKEKKTDEEIIHPNGMKHLMITVPKALRDMKYPSVYSKCSRDQQKVAEQLTLRRLAKYLEKQGKDYPSELPELDEESGFELSKEWIREHKKDSDEAKRKYETNRKSTTYIFFHLIII